MDSIHTITLDLHSTSAPVSLSVKKGDTGRQIRITLTEGSTPYKIAPGCYAVFAGTKPDDKVLWNACTIEGDTIIYELTAQTVAVVGWIPVQIRLYGAGGKLLQSPDFVLIVDAPAVEDNTVVTVSDNEVTALTQLVTECTALKADLDKFKMGGYYSPVVTQPEEGTVQFAWTASNEEMPAVPPVVVELPGGGNDSTQNVALTTAQINALDGMFKVCAFTKDDVSAEYNAFLTAFGISGGEEEPDTPVEPDDPDVTLTSITATYSGGNVAVGTAVTALTGVVVTAHYSDGTSEPVTGYTLSGTIAEGENTITVTYEGMTATFTVTGVAESGGDTEDTTDAPMDIDSWDYEWDAANETPMEDSGWNQFAAYTGFQSSFDAAIGQKLSISEAANTSVFGGFTLTDYQTATEAVCEAVVNFDTVEQGEFMMTLSDGEKITGFRILNNLNYMHPNIQTKTIFEAGVDYLLRVEFYADRLRLFVNGSLEYESADFWAPTGAYHKWGNSVKTMLLVGVYGVSEAADAANAVNIKSYKYKAVTA